MKTEIKKVKETKIISNTAYTIGSALLLNGVLQVLINPLLNRMMGSESFGVVLYITGMVAILCPSVGQALNNSRLVVRRKHDVENGDYNTMLLLFGAIGTIIVLIICRSSLHGTDEFILTIVLLMLTIFRYYGDVEYRLNLNYQKYFLYYVSVALGYVIGLGVYRITGNWFLVMILGEGLGLTYLAVTGTIFKNFFHRSPFFQVAVQRGSFLILSYLVTNLSLNIDRLMLKYLIGDLAVTQYYVVSLIGKVMVMLVAPVNTIIISYLTKEKANLNRRQFMQLSGIGIAVSFVFWICAEIGTPLFVKLFYSNLYDSVKGLMMIVNTTQILGILSAYLFIIVLTFTDERWQLTLQILHLCLLTVLILLFTGAHGIMGFAVAVFLANLIRVCLVMILGLRKAEKE